MEKTVFAYYVPCSEYDLDRIVSQLSSAWSDSDISEIKELWQGLKDVKEGRSPSLAVEPRVMKNASMIKVVEEYSFRFWFAAFHEQCQLPTFGEFTPPPAVPVLLDEQRKTHCLWCSQELKEILLQLWLYCKQDRKLFTRTVDSVWKDYAKWDKYGCGFSDEKNKMAFLLKNRADHFLSESS